MPKEIPKYINCDQCGLAMPLIGQAFEIYIIMGKPSHYFCSPECESEYKELYLLDPRI